MSNRNDLNVEVLRLFAVLSVILVHMSMGYFYSLMGSGESLYWSVNSFYFSVTRFCVPIFFIASAYLAFTYESKSTWLQKLKKLMVPYLAWSIIYFYWNGGSSVFDLISKTFLATTSFHLWFIPAFIGFSIILPIIKSAFTEENKERFRHIVVFVFMFIVLIPTIVTAFNVVTGTDHSYLYAINQFCLALPAYLIYALAFPYLHKRINPKKGLFAFLTLVLINWGVVTSLSLHNNKPDEYLYGYTTLFVFFESFIIFNVITSIDMSSMNKKISSFVKSVGNCSFGIYLCHWLIFEVLNRNSLIVHEHPLLAPLVNTLIVFTASYLFVYLLKKVKYVNRLI
ncbi:acyltransferase [Escherichia coli]|uniref:acyltransferase n=1 Tax=Escherichia coli TaxID=562 RepID=UPI0012FFAC63|nr:acyltransferase family protein [Escherichia coli]MBC0384527.1 acyltransferase family protein [Escherichia coli]HBV7788731.1 acyltransferase family protein [Escherichia coli]